jgi:hypothetical protein
MDTISESPRIEKIKELVKIVFIYNALENGWTIKKGVDYNSFEFTRPVGPVGPVGPTHNRIHNRVRSRSISEPIVLFNSF